MTARTHATQRMFIGYTSAEAAQSSEACPKLQQRWRSRQQDSAKLAPKTH
jgi:hypothetical protein